MREADGNEVLVRTEGLRKSYSGLVAVSDAAIEIYAGEVVGLLGKNGAGKSTLIKLLAGVERADVGHVWLLGDEVDIRHHSTASSRAAGMAVMFQELELIPGASVADNVSLGMPMPRHLGLFVNVPALHQHVMRVLDTVDTTIDVSANVDSLGPAQQRGVMIARALYQGARLLVLDEPTTSLTTDEITALHSLLRNLAADGKAVIYVSHRLEEVIAVTDRVIVMRDGAVVATERTADMTIHGLIATITGDVTGTTAVERRAQRAVNMRKLGPVRLSVEGLGRRGVLHDVSFEVHASEILGIAGLVGSGRTELLRSIFGADRIDSGDLTLDGKPLKVSQPRDAIAAGLALLPEDRRHQGLVESFGIRENVTLASLAAFRSRRLPLPSTRHEREATLKLMESLGMSARGPDQLVSFLSGGTQQKVVLAKWMLRNGQVLMFDEPTQGIDVAAKEDIYTLLEQLAAEGAAIILVSSEFSELVAVCNRIIVLRGGSLVATLEGEGVSEEVITDASYSGAREQTMAQAE